MRLQNLITIIYLFSFIINVSAQTDSKDYFPLVRGWEIDNHSAYTSHDLYSAINGAAELYLKYNFSEMQRVDYLNDTNYITVEVYRHESPIDAFGVYSRERPTQEELFFDIGVQGYKEQDYIHFNAGQYYIKIRALHVTDSSIGAMNKIARMQARLLNNGAEFPTEFKWFPEQDQAINSEKYYSSDILGYKFLHSSYEVSYKKGDQKFVAFILKGNSEEDANNMLKAYFEYFDLMFERSTDHFYHLDDKYNGPITILKKEKWLICSRGKINLEGSQELLTEIGNNVE